MTVGPNGGAGKRQAVEANACQGVVARIASFLQPVSFRGYEDCEVSVEVNGWPAKPYLLTP